MNPKDEFEKRLEQVMSPYKDTLALVDYLLAEKRNAQEIILIICARLDALANLAIKNVDGQQRIFTQFISQYSGEKKAFNRISTGDLYSSLISYGDMADGVLIEKPGRIKRFSAKIEDEDFLYFIEKSTIPITGESVRQLTYRVARILEKNFRVKPRQRLDKDYTVSSTELKALITQEFRVPEPSRVIEGIKFLIDRFKISSILYREFRCEAVHGFNVQVNDKDFFEKDKPFYEEIESFLGTSFHVTFPGRYLRNLLEKTIDTYIHQLKSEKKVPIALHTELYTPEEILEGNAIDFLDDDTLGDFEDVRWRLKER